MKAPLHPRLRKYLLDLAREERALEHLYRLSHNAEELTAIRAEWKASYRSIRMALIDYEKRTPAAPRMSSAVAIPVPETRPASA